VYRYLTPGSGAGFCLETKPGSGSATLHKQLKYSGAGIQYRFLHTSPGLAKKAASSKVEETVIRLRERQQETLENISKVIIYLGYTCR
jgi:hypothetical protein